jgi:hypothetical protein
MATLETIRAARSAFAQARTELIDRLFAFEKATGELREARRRLGPGSDLQDFINALSDAQSLLSAARANEASRRSALQVELTAWLPTDPNPLAAAEADVGRLGASSPIVLLPVRLETRFDAGVLKVRVFPDELFLNIHETALTEEERDAARRYYEELNENNNEPKLWRDLIARFGVPRSAYILRQMLPVFGDPGPTSMWSASSSLCGGTIFGGNKEQLFFPDVQLRSASWTRPGEAVLPDRWLVTAVRGSIRRHALGQPILEPLALTPDPKTLDQTSQSELMPTSRGGYRIDDNVRWTVDFQRALEVGMAIELPLQDGDAVAGFDRVIVVGVKTSMDPIDTSRLLEKLLDAHHYTRGMAIVRQGSPTNNTETQATPYPPKDNAGELSFGIERQRAPLDRDISHHCLRPDTDGYALAALLGVPSGVMANVERAYEHEIARARLMNQALWPGTLGYFMRHLMDAAITDENPIFSPQQIEDAREYFTNYVLGRGPAPAFRVGGTPYGVLPITSLAHWHERDFGPTDAKDERMQAVENALIQPLRRLLAFWLEGAGKVPRLTPGAAKPDVELALVLSNYPSMREIWVRRGKTFTFTLHEYLIRGWYADDVLEDLLRQGRLTFGRLGFESWRPALSTTLWARRSHLATIPLVSSELSETLQLPVNFISGILNASAQALNEQNFLGFPAEYNFLYAMLRHSTLAEYSRLASLQTTIKWTDLGPFGVFPTAAIIPSVYSLDQEGALRPLAAAHRTALNELLGVPSAELERLFTETMDVASRRLDAWITAVAYRRVNDMRREQERTSLATKGDFLGGYGWLEDVRPVARDTETLSDARAAEIQPGNGGFIHTPSMSHAAAAAVLRNGYLSFKDEKPAGELTACAIDLSSRRVREGRSMFEAVQNGQPVGSLLGYQFERALHEGYPTLSGLDELRFKLRSRFPLVANKSGQDGDEPAEVIAARNVIDGERLLAAYRNGELDFENDPDLPSPATDPDRHRAVVAELDKLEQRYDAAADLLTAEAVFQFVRGNVDGAAPTMANITSGQRPPDTVISKSARGGIGISHRVVLAFPAGIPLELPGTWPAPTARAIAEPVLDAWLGQLVGDPAGIRAAVSYLDLAGAVIPIAGGGESATVRLDELGLRPMDLLALAEVVAQAGQASMLDRRIVATALNDPNRAPSAPAATFRVEYAVTAGRSFPQALEVLYAAHAVLKASRPLELADLLPPAEIDEGTTEEASQPIGALTALDFYRRGLAAANALRAAHDVLDAALTNGTGFRSALEGAAAFSPLSAFPEPGVADEALEPAARAALKELKQRVAQLPAPFTPIDDPAEFKPSTVLLAHGKRSLELAFGSSFVALPDVDPPRPDEIQLSLDARDTLLDGDDGAPDRYLQQMMRSRARLGRFRKLNLYARSMGLGRLRVDVLQLPHVPGERWLGLPFDSAPEQGRGAALLLSYGVGLDASVAWRGLVIDDWTEVIPNKTEDTGVAFHCRSPKAQAPQAVLVAAPARADANWSLAELLGAVEQTMDLMKVRAVETEYLELGQMLPATVVGANANITNTVTTNLGGFLAQAARQALDNG